MTILFFRLFHNHKAIAIKCFAKEFSQVLENPVPYQH